LNGVFYFKERLEGEGREKTEERKEKEANENHSKGHSNFKMGCGDLNRSNWSRRIRGFQCQLREGQGGYKA
jgi:hypothetical protein